MNIEPQLIREADRHLRAIFADFSTYRITSQAAKPHDAFDLQVVASTGKASFRFYVDVKSRLAPQIALSVHKRFAGLPKDGIPVIYAPVISPRVAEILRENEVCYFDRAGNCWLRNRTGTLLIERQGFKSERQKTPSAVDVFSPKSSRIVRMLLSKPDAAWRVRELAGLPEVDVSPGLVVKVKQALVEEGYAIVADGFLRLRDPAGLLEAWCRKYPGPAETIPLYLRGDSTQVERTVSQWCQAWPLRHALASFSAAWQLAPEVRPGVVSMYLDASVFDGNALPAELAMQRLLADTGARRVESGANLLLLCGFDVSVFTGIQPVEGDNPPCTSPLQTYLDLRRASGRGQEAAQAIFDRYLQPAFTAAAGHKGGK